MTKSVEKVIDIIHDLRDELEHYHTRKFVRMIVDEWGSLGIVFVAIQDYEVHGKNVFPLTHKYYKDIVSYLIYALRENRNNRLHINKVMKGH